MNATKSVFYHQQQILINNNNSKLFDVTMGGKHGAEICEIVGLYILNCMRNKIKGPKAGIYRDGLIALEKIEGIRDHKNQEENARIITK